jgi:hypothetical protein
MWDWFFDNLAEIVIGVLVSVCVVGGMLLFYAAHTVHVF